MMLCKIGNRWIDYQQPIDLLDLLSYMEIGLCWYQNNNESIWTYDLTDHVMVELEIIIALATMTYIVKTNSYGLYQWLNKCLLIL